MADGPRSDECVKVCVRCRPISKQENIDNRERVVDVDTTSGCITVRRPGERHEPGKPFTFDQVFPPEVLQSLVYQDAAFQIVDSVMEGFNGTIFAYGQTGTGKTHTMVGVEGDANLKGIIPRSFEHIFEYIDEKKSDNTDGKITKFLVRVSYLELYNEEIRDLLSKNPKQKLELKDHPERGVFVKDLSEFSVSGVSEMTQVMTAGQRNRSVAATLMNSESSRSHSIFTITVERADYDLQGEEHVRVGKLNLVDLAGSERQSKTGATGDTLKEATKINLSLSALGNVISALVDGKSSHIAYRDSKLTRLLQDSLGGNTKTVMIANIGPADYNYDETLSTLRYAHRAKSIKNKPKINEDPHDAVIRKFQEEIARLKAQLAAKGDGGGGLPLDGGVEVRDEVRVVEKVVEVEKVIEGVSEEDVKTIEQRIAREKGALHDAMTKERQEIEQQKDMAESEKQRLLEELAAKQAEAEQQQQHQERMLQKLKHMEAKMIVGTQAMEKALEQENHLKKARRELERKKREERRMREEMAQQEQEKELLEQRFSSVEDQVQKLTEKLSTLYGRYQSVTQDVDDLQHEFQKEREDLLATIRDFQREVKLKTLIVDAFIPMEERIRIEESAQYSEETVEWLLPLQHLTGNNLKREHGDRFQAAEKKRNGKTAQNEAEPEINAFFDYVDGPNGVMATRSERKLENRVEGSGRRPATGGRPGTASRKGRAVKAR